MGIRMRGRYCGGGDLEKQSERGILWLRGIGKELTARDCIVGSLMINTAH
jgi:hypothetical protein